MVERESKVKTKANTKKKLLIAAGVVVVALAAALIFISNYLVNYAIGRSGNGGDREVALEVDAPADSVEAAMEGNLCRCMAYVRIKKAIKLAAGRGAKA